MITILVLWMGDAGFVFAGDFGGSFASSILDTLSGAYS